MTSPQTILFHDGTTQRLPVHAYGGACISGQPTAYVCRDGKLVWVVPGESVAWVEA